MLDWLRYFPIALRWENNPKRVKGPYLSKLWLRKFNLSGSELEIRLPVANSVLGVQPLGRSIRRTLRVAPDLLYADWESENSNATLNRWQHSSVYLRDWLFTGEWFTRPVSDIVFSIDICGQMKLDEFEESSFFHPRVFESVIADFLNSRYGHRIVHGRQRYCAPVDWKVLDVSPTIKAVCFDVHEIGNSSRETPGVFRLVFMPLTHDRFLKIEFNLLNSELYSDKAYVKPMLELCSSVMESIALKPSVQSLQQWNEVKKSCPDMSLTKEFGELKWPIKPEDLGKPQPLPPEDKAFDKIDSLSE